MLHLRFPTKKRLFLCFVTRVLGLCFLQNKAVPEVTPLHIAAATGNVDVIKLLLPLCDVNRQDQWGFSALHYATVARKTEAVHLLLSNGASASLASKVAIVQRCD